jgi:hypothetical protein
MNKNGIILLNVIIILLTIAIVGASLVIFFSSVDLSARTVADEAKAMYLAEAGISHAVYLLRNEASSAGELGQTIGPVSLGDGAYMVDIDLAHCLITSSGKVGSVEKTVQLQYSAL